MSVAVVSDIVPLDKSVGLKVYNADVQELLEGHGKQLTSEGTGKNGGGGNFRHVGRKGV